MFYLGTVKLFRWTFLHVYTWRYTNILDLTIAGNSKNFSPQIKSNICSNRWRVFPTWSVCLINSFEFHTLVINIVHTSMLNVIRSVYSLTLSKCNANKTLSHAHCLWCFFIVHCTIYQYPVTHATTDTHLWSCAAVTIVTVCTMWLI